MPTVTLINGPTIRTNAIALAVALEDTGHALSVRDGQLLVTNGSTLTPEQRAAIRGAKWHLMAFAGYEGVVE